MNITLRAIEPSDLDSVLKWENDSSAWDYSDVVAPLSRRILQDYIASYNADPFAEGQLRLIIADGQDNPLGIADLYDISAIHAHAFVGIYVDPEQRNKGIATESLTLLCEYAIHRLGIRTLAALILPENNISINLFTKYGFKHSGTLPSWRRTASGFSDVEIFTLYHPR